MTDIPALRAAAVPLPDEAALDAVLPLVGDASLVLIGESSHGSDEFYRIRAALTRRLVERHGFTAVAVEADWPDAFRVNRFVRGLGSDPDPDRALAGFARFPQWMWRNTAVREFVGWLREWNAGRRGPGCAGFYGLDLYSLHGSIAAVLAYLDRVDPEAARRARTRYRCFDHFGTDPQEYGYLTAAGVRESCEDAVVEQLVELRRRAPELARADGPGAADELFAAEQNARLVLDAERYYRSTFRGRDSSWNLRDTHMADTLDALVVHLERQGVPPKVVVWAHNSHLGDARATEMGRGGELNLGQLTRQRHGPDRCFLLGFTTHTGTVSAASDWGDPVERKRVRPSLAGSYERLLHEVGLPRFGLDLHGEAADALLEPRLERAIGVIYRPETERLSHYFHAVLPEQFDAVIHVDETHALEPLERTGAWDAGELAETFPSGI